MPSAAWRFFPTLNVHFDYMFANFVYYILYTYTKFALLYVRIRRISTYVNVVFVVIAIPRGHLDMYFLPFFCSFLAYIAMNRIYECILSRVWNCFHLRSFTYRSIDIYARIYRKFAIYNTQVSRLRRRLYICITS